MKNQVRKSTGQVAAFAVMLVITIIMVFPLLWLLSASFQGPGEVYLIPFHWIPRTWQFNNYVVAWKDAGLFQAMCSSMVVSIIYIAIHLTVCSITGYVFAKFDFKGKNLIFMLIIGTMMIPQDLTYLPLYDIVKKMHLVNQYLGVALPLCISATGVFMMRQFAKSVPNAILEAAKVDGCGNAGTFFRIGLPMLKDGIIALAILAFSYIWNEFTWSKIILMSNSKATLPLALTAMVSNLQTHHDFSISNVLASSVIALIPVVVIFAVFQKNFIESMVSSGIKG